MKKLNNVEIDVLVNVIIENVEKEKLSRVNDLLKDNSDYLEVKERISEYYELKKVEDELREKINNLNKNLSEKFKVNVYYNDYNSYNNKDCKVSLNYKEKEKFSYSEVKKRVVLNNINSDINVEEFIKKFVEDLI
jgi:hypothetical protein